MPAIDVWLPFWYIIVTLCTLSTDFITKTYACIAHIPNLTRDLQLNYEHYTFPGASLSSTSLLLRRMRVVYTEYPFSCETRLCINRFVYVLRSIPSQTPPAHILYACCMQIIYYAKTERRKPYLVEHAIALSLQNRFAYSVVRAKFPTIHGSGNKHFEIGK